jgi:hypothetical protein
MRRLRDFTTLLLALLMVYTVGQTFTVAWDDPNVPAADSYVVMLVRQGTGETFTYGTSQKQMTILVPKSGKYEVRIKAVRNQLESTSCSSLNPACGMLKTGINGDWVAYKKPASAGGLLIMQ